MIDDIKMIGPGFGHWRRNFYRRSAKGAHYRAFAFIMRFLYADDYFHYASTHYFSRHAAATGVLFYYDFVTRATSAIFVIIIFICHATTLFSAHARFLLRLLRCEQRLALLATY